MEEKNVANERKLKWKVSAIAVSVVLGMIFATFIMGENKTNKFENLGTVEDPEVAYKETVKALELVSKEINKGASQVKYLNEYENTKKLIFK